MRKGAQLPAVIDGVALTVHWRAIPSGIRNGAWRFTVMPSFHFESAGVARLPEDYEKLLHDWPATVEKMEFSLHIAPAPDVRSLGEENTAHEKRAGLPPYSEQFPAGYVDAGKRILKRATRDAVVPQRPSTSLTLRLKGTAAKPTVFRGFNDSASSAGVANLRETTLKLRASEMGQPLVRLAEVAAHQQGILIGVPHLQGSEFARLHSRFRIFKAPNAPLADGDGSALFESLRRSEDKDMSWLERDLERIDHGWASTLTRGAFGAASQMALIRRANLPDRKGDELFDSLIQAWIRSRTLLTDETAEFRKIAKPFDVSSRTLMQIVEDSVSDLMDSGVRRTAADVVNDNSERKNILRYLLAHHHEAVKNVCGVFSDAELTELNNIDNRLANVAGWPAIAHCTRLAFDIVVPDAEEIFRALAPDQIHAVRIFSNSEFAPFPVGKAFYWTTFQHRWNVTDTAWPIPNPLLDGKVDAELVRGTLNLRRRYALRHVDVDAGIRSAVYQAQAIDTQLAAGLTTDELEVAQKNLPTCGIAVVATEIVAEAEDSKKAEEQQEEQFLRGLSILTGAQDLAVGYRIDVKHGNADWMSLFTRDVTYDFDAPFGKDYELTIQERSAFAAFAKVFDKPFANDKDGTNREEGFARAVSRETLVQEDGEDSHEVFPAPALCVWRDRNLAVPDAEQATDDPFANSPQTQISGESTYDAFSPILTLDRYARMPRLRLNNDYLFGARVVYANGASLEIEAAKDVYLAGGENGTGLGESERPYRFLDEDPCLPPLSHLQRAIRGVATPGDEIDTLIIRSGPDIPAAAASTSRWLVPARVTLEFAELYGSFDGFSDLPGGALGGYKLTSTGDVPSVRSLELLPCAPVASRKLKEDPHCNDTVLVRGKTSADSFPYYPDPRARGFAMAIVDDPKATHADPRQLLKVTWRGARAWPDLQPIELSAQGGGSGVTAIRADGNYVDFASGPRRLDINVPPGDQIVVRIWSVMDDGPEFRMANISALASAVSANAHNLAAAFGSLATMRDTTMGDASHPASNPSRHIRVIHALQKPLRAPVFGVDFAVRRFAEELDAEAKAVVGNWNRKQTQTGAVRHAALLEGTVIADRKSTGRLEIRATREDWIDDLHKDAPCLRSVSDELTAIDPIDNSAGRADPVSLQIDDAGAERNIWHELNDTKHHEVTYHLRAHSCFSHLFPKQVGKKTLDFTRESTEAEANGRTVHIVSTQRPAGPALSSIIPTFVHQSRFMAGETTTSRRTGLRLWLDRPWFSSGNGEQLAIICGPGNILPRNRRAGTDEAPPRTNRWRLCDIPSNAHPYVSQVGLDPTFATGELVEVLPPHMFTRADGTAAMSDGDLLLAESGNAEVSEVRVAAALFDVGPENYDCNRKQYFVDIGINMPALSWQPEVMGMRPFIRLALARYQQHSLRDRELSSVVIADMVQLQPNRSLSVRYDSRRRDVIEVEVAGYTQTESVLTPKQGPAAASSIADQYSLDIDLLARGRGQQHWVPVKCEKSVGVKPVGDGYLARARFTIDKQHRDKLLAVRFEETLERPHHPASRPPKWDKPFEGTERIAQPVLFMLQPLTADGGLEDA